MDYKELTRIVNSKEIQPTIINEKSNFVVVTYWWGRGNKNSNTSRPCISFFEQFITQIQMLCIKSLGSIRTVNKEEDLEKVYNNLVPAISRLNQFKNIIQKKANDYNGMIYDYLGILPKEADKENKALIKLEKLKSSGKTPADYEYKDNDYVVRMFTYIMLETINIIKDNIWIIFETNNKIISLKKGYTSKKTLVTLNEKKQYLQDISELKKTLDTQKAEIKKKLNEKQTEFLNENMKDFLQMSIFEILNKEFRFLSPLHYDDMISSKWVTACEKSKCNYMTVEYPEFALPGGYQMAINAKPLFIKKALEAVGHRSVLYIDGDMLIKKYPAIFDLKDGDYMARGWWMDPRSSYKMDESIMYDPYTFETSGGTMMFSQSNESLNLIDKWIEVSGSPAQIGKADDRLISLIFNTYKLLSSMKIIQLPIEYLWLTLDFSERLLEVVYDYNAFVMEDTIIIEHPECLTSEDTASGSGASSDRTPKFYSYLEENQDPVSEQFHEYIMFPSQEMRDTMKPYLDFMTGVQYLNDGNEILVKKGFVNLEHPEENEQPLYITKYADKYGNMKYPQDSSLTYNDVASINMKRASQMVLNGLNLEMKEDGNTVELNDFSKLMKEDDAMKYNHAKIISLIIRLLKDGKTVIYNPRNMEGYDVKNYNNLIEKAKTKYSSMEFIFMPAFNNIQNTSSSNYFYKPQIQTNQAMLFRPCDILINFLMMFLSIDDFSSYLNYGSYEFMSRVRVGYIIREKEKKNATMTMTGGDFETDIDSVVNAYNNGLDILYKGGRRFRNKRLVNRKIYTQRKKHLRRYTKKIKKYRKKVYNRKSKKGSKNKRTR